MSEALIGDIIGGIALILAAIITGIFTYKSQRGSNQPGQVSQTTQQSRISRFRVLRTRIPLYVILLFVIVSSILWVLFRSVIEASQELSMVEAGKSKISHQMQPVKFFDFDNSDEVPGGIHPFGDQNNKFPLKVARSNEISNKGNNALQLDANFSRYDVSNETGYTGIYIDLGELEPIDAVYVDVLIPGRTDLNTADDFQVFFIGKDSKGYPIYSGPEQIEIGKWTPFFWGLKYAYSGENLCEDANRDTICDKEAGIWWYQLDNPQISGLEIRITRTNGNYQGPVYLDNIGLFRVVKP